MRLFFFVMIQGQARIINKKKNPWLVFPSEFRESFRNNYSTEQF